MTDWWQRAAIYQIFPRSFQDSNADGEGDIPGIISRLDYLSWLGMDAICLGPVYRSPLLDSGYDVSDFRRVDPVFGRSEDLDRLIAECYGRGIKVILDFTPNHTSDQHPWFVESKASRDSERRRWFVWEDPRPDGSAPNNWLDNLGNSAWTLDKASGQYYYHRFLPEQPDLNWRNPAVEEEIMATLRFWLDRGVDGFRMDGIANLVEDDLLRDDPMEPEQSKGPPGWTEHVFSSDRRETHHVVARMRNSSTATPTGFCWAKRTCHWVGSWSITAAGSLVCTFPSISSCRAQSLGTLVQLMRRSTSISSYFQIMRGPTGSSAAMTCPELQAASARRRRGSLQCSC